MAPLLETHTPHPGPSVWHPPGQLPAAPVWEPSKCQGLLQINTRHRWTWAWPLCTPGEGPVPCLPLSQSSGVRVLLRAPWEHCVIGLKAFLPELISHSIANIQQRVCNGGRG